MKFTVLLACVLVVTATTPQYFQREVIGEDLEYDPDHPRFSWWEFNGDHLICWHNNNSRKIDLDLYVREEMSEESAMTSFLNRIIYRAIGVQLRRGGPGTLKIFTRIHRVVFPEKAFDELTWNTVVDSIMAAVPHEYMFSGNYTESVQIRINKNLTSGF
jgi:hypothetical protein